MTLKDDIREYQARWTVLEAFIAEERRTASPEIRWQQLNTAYAIAKGLAMLNEDVSEVEVFERWAKIKEKAAGHSPQA